MSTHARRLRASARPAALTILLVLGLAPAAADARCRGATLAPSSAARAARSAAVICEINRERRSRGLAAVHADARLRRAAERYAHSMVRLGFFSHTSPAGSTLLDRLRVTGYGGRGYAVGEVLAWAEGRLAAPRAVVRSWIASPPHRAVLLARNYRDIGIGVVLGSPHGHRGGGSATYAANLGSERR